MASHRYQLSILLFIVFCGEMTNSQYWFPPDNIDAIREAMDAVNSLNCQSLNLSDLRLPIETLSQLPKYSASNQLRHPNRTLLWDAHSLALSKGIATSFAFARLNESMDFYYQPGLMYHYMSTVADVVSNTKNITGSGIFYDNNMTYANWYSTLPFNTTLPLFGPKAYDIDPNNQSSILDNDVDVVDLGAGPDHNYTRSDYMHNPWYELFLPDPDENIGLDPVRKTDVVVHIKDAGSIFHPYVFFYADLPEDGSDPDYEPVLFTAPYFDCGKTNRWVVSAVAPVLDWLPRYLDWTHLRRHRFLAETVVDVDYEMVDMNQCPLGVGNEPPNEFAGTDHCKQTTTTCSPLPGFGFTRGGYECSCLPGHVYPPGQNGPFQGVDIENSTQQEYVNGFDCITAEAYQTLQESKSVPNAKSPGNHQNEELSAKIQKRKFVPRYSVKLHQDEPMFDHRARIEADKTIMQFLYHNGNKERKLLDVAYGMSEQYNSQARHAVRLANFLSNYLQNLKLTPAPEDPKEDLPLHKDLLAGELVGLILTETKLIGCGIYFDEDKYLDSQFNTSQFLGLYTYRETAFTCGLNQRADGDIKIRDRSNDTTPYYEQSWFVDVRDKWNASTAGLQTFQQRSLIRSDIDGTDLVEFRRNPMSYRAAGVSNGAWSDPYCPCDGEVDTNIVTFSVPFFGPATVGLPAVEFFGVVAVDIAVENLDINQCYQPFWEPHPFKNTAMCDYATTTCEPIPGGGFTLGNYQCVCKPGFTYPDGQEGPFTSNQAEEAYVRGSFLSCIPLD